MTKPPRILHVVPSLEGGGVERLLVKSLALFDREKFDHRVCCITKGGVYEPELRSLNIPYWIMKRRFRFDPSIVYQMAKLMREERIQIVHTLNFTANAWGRLAARFAKVPKIIAHERGTAWTENATMRRIDRYLEPLTDIWLTNSRAAEIMLTQHIGISSKHIKVIYNGVPDPKINQKGQNSLRQSLGIGAKDPIMGAIGRLDTLKGHIYLLRAIPTIWESFPCAHFVFMGKGPLESILLDQAERLGVLKSRQVHFLGFVMDAPQKMHELDLLIHPSVWEALGNVIIEANLARLPVIASNVDGIPEIIINGETGTLIDCHQPVELLPAPGASPVPEVVVDGKSRKLRPPASPSPDLLAQTVIRLLNDDEMRLRLGENGRTRARRYFSLNRYVQELENIYRSIL
ncbi:MAG TPA: glycosyltransferase [Anaerolineales bacterium]